MTLNIYTQICGIVITAIIFIFYMLQRKMGISKERNYLACIFITFLVLCFDIAATVLNTYKTDAIVTVYVNRVYLLSTIATVFLVFLYICGEAFSRKGFNATAACSAAIYLVLLIFIINPSFTTNNITCEANGAIIYTTGSATLITYITSFILIIIVLVETFFYKKVLGEKQTTAIRIWMVMWSAFAITQYFFKQFLICSFALSLGIMIMYIALETLDGSVDKNTGLFNWNGYVKYVIERKKDGLACPVVYLKATDAIHAIEKKTLTESLGRFNNCLIEQKSIKSFSYQKEYLIVLSNCKLDDFLAFLESEREEHPIIANYYYPIFIQDSTKLSSQEIVPSLVELASTKINKSDGNYITIGDDIIQSYNNNIETERLIEQAINNDWVEVYYQPIYNLVSKKFTTAEALVRLKDETGKIVPPGVFIPVAEKNGMIHKLDEMVFDKVCTFIETHSMEELGLDYIEVNLSVAQLCDDSLSLKYASILRKHKIKPSYINLEVTESAELERRMVLKRNMNKLLTLGVSFSLDDYGTGYSNLNYVVDMPVGIIKFDKLMIDSYFKDSKANRLMEYSIQMFKSLNLKIVAEGVEELYQVEELKLLAVDYIQGYYYSKPIPSDDFINFLENNK